MGKKKKSQSDIIKNDFVSRKEIAKLFLVYQQQTKSFLLQKIIDMPGLKRKDLKDL